MGSPDVECGQMWLQLKGRPPIWLCSTEMGWKMSCPSAACCSPSPPSPSWGQQGQKGTEGVQSTWPLGCAQPAALQPGKAGDSRHSTNRANSVGALSCCNGERGPGGPRGPAAAQPVNGSPHLLLPHLTTRLQNNSLPGACAWRHCASMAPSCRVPHCAQPGAVTLQLDTGQGSAGCKVEGCGDHGDSAGSVVFSP